MSHLELLDWIVIAAYFLGLIGLAFWVLRKKNKDTKDYFLAGKNIGWFVIGASIFASNIGSEHLVGLAGTGAESGVAMAHWELHAWVILILGWLFVPFYAKSNVFTMPEFLEKRYNSTSRWFLSIISLVGYILTKVSVTIFAGGVIFETLMGIDFWTGALIVVILTGIYTAIGGLRAVVYTEALQTFVLIAGSVAVTIIGLHKIGGWENLKEVVGTDHFNMWKSLDHPKFPWLGIILGTPIIGVWYWCTDQYIVQRTLAARNITQARRGTIFAGYLKLLPVFIFLVPGIIAYALAKTGQIELGSSNQALPAMVIELLPTGFRGLVAGGMLAALMSSLAALFNSCSTLFTKDLYEKLRPQSSEKHLLMVGRLATIALTGLGIAWIPLMKYVSGELYEYLQSVQSYIAPPLAAVFLLGIFSKRINGKGANAALIAGFAIGMIRLVLEIFKGNLSGIWYDFANINFLYFCFSLFMVCVAIMVIVSLFSAKPDISKIEDITYSRKRVSLRNVEGAAFSKWDIVHTIVIVGFVALIMIYFTG